MDFDPILALKVVNTNKKWIPTLLGVLVLLSSIAGVQAWGVAHGDKELSLTEGETHTIRTSLQNMIGDEDLTVFIKLRGDTGVAELSETEVVLPPKTKSHPIYIEVTIPEDAQKDSYQISAVYTEKEKGGIMVNIAMEKVITFNIDVVDVEEPPPDQQDPDNIDTGSGTISIPPDTSNQEGVRPEQSPDTIQTQEDNPIPAVPDVSDEGQDTLTEGQEDTENPDGYGSWLWIVIIIVAIGGVSGYLWWDGWI